MDVPGIATAAATEMTQGKTADAIHLAVLKKAMGIHPKGAMRSIRSYFHLFHFVPIGYLSLPTKCPMGQK